MSFYLQSLENVDLGQVVDRLRKGGTRAHLEQAEASVLNHMLLILDRGDGTLGLERPKDFRKVPTPDYLSMQQLLCVVFQHFERFPGPHPACHQEWDLQKPVPARLDFHSCAMLMLAQWAVQYDLSDPPAIVKAMSLGTLECSRHHLLVEYSFLRQNCSRQIGETAMLDSEPAHAPWADPPPSPGQTVPRYRAPKSSSPRAPSMWSSLTGMIKPGLSTPDCWGHSHPDLSASLASLGPSRS